MKFENIIKILLTLSLASFSCSPVLASEQNSEKSKINISELLQKIKEKKEKKEKENKDKKNDKFTEMLKMKEKREKEEKEKKDKTKIDGSNENLNSFPGISKEQNKNLNEKENDKKYGKFIVKFNKSLTETNENNLLIFGEFVKSILVNKTNSTDIEFKDSPSIADIKPNSVSLNFPKVVEIPLSYNDKQKVTAARTIINNYLQNIKNNNKSDDLRSFESTTKDGKKIRLSEDQLKKYIKSFSYILFEEVKEKKSAEKNAPLGETFKGKQKNPGENNLSTIDKLQKQIENLDKKFEKRFEKLNDKCKKLSEKIKKNNSRKKVISK